MCPQEARDACVLVHRSILSSQNHARHLVGTQEMYVECCTLRGLCRAPQLKRLLSHLKVCKISLLVGIFQIKIFIIVIPFPLPVH